MNEILKVIDCFVSDLQGISGAKAERYKEEEAGLTGDDNEEIHTKDREVYTKDIAVHVNNEDGVGSSASFSDAGLFRLAKINGVAAVEGKNQNEAEGADFSALVNSDLENTGMGNHRTAPWMLRSGKMSHPPSMYSIFLNKAMYPMKHTAEIGKRVEEG